MVRRPAILVGAGRGASFAIAAAVAAQATSQAAGRTTTAVRALALVSPLGIADAEEGAELPSAAHLGALVKRLARVPLLAAAVVSLVTSRGAINRHLKHEVFDAPERADAARRERWYRSARQPGAERALLAYLAGDLALDVSAMLPQLTVPVWLGWGRQAIVTAGRDGGPLAPPAAEGQERPHGAARGLRRQRSPPPPRGAGRLQPATRALHHPRRMSKRDSPFPPVPGGYPFPRLELEVLERWRRDSTFRRSVAQSAGRPEWVFYEGPPTANNVPHVGHVVTRVVKDLFPRYRTMRGFHVARKAGWDTHGLAVEIEVEKQLGFSGKQQIEAYGIAEFNKACLDSVHSYERQWRAMTERVGYWTDLDHAYFTYSNEYVESVWWSLQQLWRQGLLVQDYKIQPYCTRCGTTLSSHEVAQNYKDADDPSMWVLFPARPGQEVASVDGPPLPIGDETAFVAWTTTPWTLDGARGAGGAPGDGLPRRRAPDASRGTGCVFGDEIEKPVPLEVDASRAGKRKRLDLRDLPAIARVRGRDLEGLRYDRPYRVGNPDRVSPEPWPAFADLPPSDENGWRVLLAGYVTATEGTGIVHTSLPFGEDDYATGARYRLPFYLTVDAQGKIADKPGLEPFAGMWFKDADPPITRDVKARGLLLHGERYKHNYPFCWRCDSPLLYYASLVVVHPHDAAARRPGREEPHHRLAPADDRRGALRQLAGERRRLGAVAQALLGHAAAGVAVRRLRGERVHRQLRRAVRARRAAAAGRTSTTARRSTRTGRSSTR